MRKLFLCIFLKIFEKMLCHILSSGDLTIYSESKRVHAAIPGTRIGRDKVDLWCHDYGKVSNADVKCVWKITDHNK